MSFNWLIIPLALLACFTATATNRDMDNLLVLKHSIEQDFSKWKNSNEGRSASLALMKKRCDEVVDTKSNLSCSLFVLSIMLERKSTNQIPDYYQLIKKKHAETIEREPALRALFSMLGPKSLLVLKAAPAFSIKRSTNNHVLPITPYISDMYISEKVFPHVVVRAESEALAKFIFDTGTTITRVDYETAERFGVEVLADSQYIYGSFYGKEYPAKLGILPYLEVGGVEFRNVLVFVGNEENLLGLDIINKLGRIKVTKKSIQFDSQLSSQCDSRVLYHQEENNVNQHLTFVVLLNDKPIMAILDTGNSEGISLASLGDGANETLSSGGDKMLKDIVTGFEYKTFTGVLTSPKTSMEVIYRYYPEYRIPPSLLLDGEVPSLLFGWQMFDDFELHLDIQSGRSCINKVYSPKESK